MDIAFHEEMQSIPGIEILDNITTALFTIDIIFGFMTSYINVSSGEEIYSLRMIAINYICAGPFFIDIFSTFPLDKIAKALEAPKAVEKTF